MLTCHKLHLYPRSFYTKQPPTGVVLIVLTKLRIDSHLISSPVLDQITTSDCVWRQCADREPNVLLCLCPDPTEWCNVSPCAQSRSRCLMHTSLMVSCIECSWLWRGTQWDGKLKGDDSSEDEMGRNNLNVAKWAAHAHRHGEHCQLWAQQSKQLKMCTS